MAKHASASTIQATHNRYYGATGFTAFIAFWANYVNFRGRTARREYWWNFLFLTIIMTVIMFVSMGLLFSEIMQDPSKFTHPASGLAIFGQIIGFTLIWAVVGLVSVLPSLAQGVRRFRDAGIHWGFFVALEVVGLLADGLMFGGQTGIAYVLSAAAGITVFVITLLPSKNPPEEP